MGGTTAMRRAAQLLALVCLMSWAGGASAQGLVSVPPHMTHELNAYYLSRLGRDIKYYSVLTGRNVINTNVYNLVNGLPDGTDPVVAAGLTSPVRGSYSSNGLGGRVMIDIFYKLVRCQAPPDCSVLERVLIADTVAGPKEELFVLKAGVGNTGWLINANQSAANAVLSQGAVMERLYTDPTYKAPLFYKVVPPPSPCSSASPQTALGPIGEFEDAPQFMCVQYQGVFMLLTTDNQGGIDAMRDYGVDSRLCDGSLTLFDVTDASNLLGQEIVALVRRPNALPLTLWMVLPYNFGCSIQVNAEMALKVAAFVAADAANFTGTAPKDNLNIPKGVLNLGFKTTGSCAPIYLATYGAFLAGQVNIIREQFPGNQTFASNILSSDNASVCMAAIASNDISTRDQTEDECAELFSGNAARVNEGAITYNNLNTTGPTTTVHISKLTEQCKDYYALGVANILPQIAIDFEADRVSLLSSTEVKIHMDAVAANAASIVALEIALASSGIVVARTIARSSFYRQQRISSGLARAAACTVTAAAITLFNVPNFALVVKSLQNNNARRVFTTVNTYQYKPSNFSGFVLAETHAFVAVQGSSATAIIGLILYAATLVFSLYITWGEFTEIIRRKEEVERCLGSDALADNKHLVVEWRATDAKLHELYHPTAVKESGLNAEVELMRRALARKQLESSSSGLGEQMDWQGSPRGLGTPRSPYRYQGLGSPRETYRGGPPPA